MRKTEIESFTVVMEIKNDAIIDKKVASPEAPGSPIIRGEHIGKIYE